MSSTLTLFKEMQSYLRRYNIAKGNLLKQSKFVACVCSEHTEIPCGLKLQHMD